MCPMYDYRDNNTNKIVAVIRAFKDYEITPTEEEVKDSGMTTEEYNSADWERVMAVGIQVTRGANWTGSKGNW